MAVKVLIIKSRQLMTGKHWVFVLGITRTHMITLYGQRLEVSALILALRIIIRF